jgi:hypothetical protein
MIGRLRSRTGRTGGSHSVSLSTVQTRMPRRRSTLSPARSGETSTVEWDRRSSPPGYPPLTANDHAALDPERSELINTLSENPSAQVAIVTAGSRASAVPARNASHATDVHRELRRERSGGPYRRRHRRRLGVQAPDGRRRCRDQQAIAEFINVTQRANGRSGAGPACAEEGRA